jgi:hypothetical protein
LANNHDDRSAKDQEWFEASRNNTNNGQLNYEQNGVILRPVPR